jgi:DNA polymerase
VTEHESLARAAETCAACSLATTRTTVVFSSGPTDARLILVGEAPGKTEDEGGAPFLGRSGQLLRRVLAECGFDEDSYYITNAVKCRPPANRTPTVREVRACQPWWEAQLPLLTGRVIATIGATATRAILGTPVVMAEAHGRAVSLANRVVVPMYHPAAVLRNPHLMAAFRDDVAELRKVCEA